MKDLNDLRKRLDDALTQETAASFEAWLDSIEAQGMVVRELRVDNQEEDEE